MGKRTIKVAKHKITDKPVRDDDIAALSPAERIGLVWPLTREVLTFNGKHDAEQRVQKSVTLIRR